MPLRTGESWHEGEGEHEDENGNGDGEMDGEREGNGNGNGDGDGNGDGEMEMEMEMHGEGMMNAWFPEGVKMRSVEVRSSPSFPLSPPHSSFHFPRLLLSLPFPSLSFPFVASCVRVV